MWLVAGAVWAVPPEVLITRTFDDRAAFTSIVQNDSADGARRWMLGGTSVEGMFQFYLVRIDTAGNEIWANRYGSTDRCQAIAPADDGATAMIGWTTENNTVDYKIMRALPDGTLITNWDFGSAATGDVAYGLTEYPDNWYLVSGRATPGTQGTTDGTLVHVSQTGTVAWTRVYADAERCVTAARSDSGQIFIYATADSADSVSRRDFAVVIADSAGNLLAMERIGGPQNEHLNDGLRVSTSRTILVGNVVTAAGDQDMWIVATNDSGDSIWSRTWGTTANDAAMAVARATDADSGFVVAGWSDGLSANGRCGVLIKFDQDGDTVWTITVGDTIADYEFADVIQDSNFHYHAVGLRDADFDHGFYLQTDADPRAGGTYPPNHFSLISPEEGDTLRQDTIFFDWETAIDPDSGDHVLYAVLIDTDTLFEDPIVRGPFAVSHCWWPNTVDDVRLYWRVSAQDDQDHIRICDDRQRSLVRILPDSTGPFSLAYPDSGAVLTEEYTTFRWERAFDPDLDDTLRYAVHFVTADSTVAITGLQDTFVTVTFTNHPVIDPAQEIEWYVSVRSVNPVMERNSREQWPVTTWSVDADDAPAVPLEFALRAAFPNPFNSSTTLEFALDKDSDVRLEIFTIEGRHAATVIDGRFPAGAFRMNWNGMIDTGQAAPSGVYFARLVAGDRMQTIKLMLLR